MILNEFDVYREALKKINLNEDALPIYKGRILTENVDIYCKVQKLLNCPAMEQCHRWLYDLDVENLDESECSKVNNLFKLGVDRGYLEDEQDDEDATTKECDLLPPDGNSLPAKVTDPAPVMPSAEVPPAPVSQEPPKPEAPTAAYTVVYSAVRNGEIKTGEAYSNSLNTRSAKADVISKLEKAGYQNISILAIEAGDPDMSGCDNTYCKQSDYVPPAYEDEEEKVEEADIREPLAHAFHPVGINASTANTSGQDEVKMTITEDEAKAEVKKAFDEVNKQVTDVPAADEMKTWLADNKDKLDEIKSKLDDKAQVSFDKIVELCNKYANGEVSEDEELDEAKNAKKSSSGVKTLIRGLFKILCTLVSLAGSAVGLTGKIVTWAGTLVSTGANKMNLMLKDSEEDDMNEDDMIDGRKHNLHVDEAGEDEGDDDADGSDETSEDSDDSADEEKTDDKDGEDAGDKDSKEDKDEGAEKEEDAQEPDEKLKADKKAEDGKEDASDEKSEKELTAQEKTQLKDSYKKAFKAAMQKCKFIDKSFDDLTLEEKVQFFTELQNAWGSKADPSKFMSDKEVQQLQKIVVKK